MFYHLFHELVDFIKEWQLPQLLTGEGHIPGVIVWVPGQWLRRMNSLILNLNNTGESNNLIIRNCMPFHRQHVLFNDDHAPNCPCMA